jgi:hypothetical protein
LDLYLSIAVPKIKNPGFLGPGFFFLKKDSA